MTNFQSDFQAALPFPIKWSVNENKFDDNGKNPLALSIFIPAESAFAVAQLIMDSAEDQSKSNQAKVWDYETQTEREVTGFYINGKGKPGRDGDGSSFGNINPVAKANTVKVEEIF